MNVKIIRISGDTEQHDIPKFSAIREIRKLIGADCLDTVNLRDGNVMLVDDTGMVDGKPINPEGTKLYHGVCRPGTVHCIHGDIAIARDADFA